GSSASRTRITLKSLPAACASPRAAEPYSTTLLRRGPRACTSPCRSACSTGSCFASPTLMLVPCASALPASPTLQRPAPPPPNPPPPQRPDPPAPPPEPPPAEPPPPKAPPPPPPGPRSPA